MDARVRLCAHLHALQVFCFLFCLFLSFNIHMYNEQQFERVEHKAAILGTEFHIVACLVSGNIIISSDIYGSEARSLKTYTMSRTTTVSQRMKSFQKEVRTQVSRHRCDSLIPQHKLPQWHGAARMARQIKQQYCCVL